MVPDPDGLEPQLVREAEKRNRKMGNTIVAFCLADK
jgi:hypothetical protein